MTRRWASLTVVATLVLTSMTASGVAATTGTDRQQAHSETVDPPAVVVALHEDGSVTVTVTFTYDLSDEDRKQAFEDLQNTESTRADFRDRFQQRMASVAADAANETGQEMSVSDASLSFRTEGTTGIVEASVTWTGLAAVEGDQLTVTEPFASGFQSPRAVPVFAPSGYTVSSVTPSPDAQSEGHLTWDSGNDLTGFEVVATAPDESDDATPTPADSDEITESDDGTAADEGAGDSGPGFGVVAALAAVLGSALLARRVR